MTKIIYIKKKLIPEVLENAIVLKFSAKEIYDKLIVREKMYLY